MSQICAGIVTFNPDLERLKINVEHTISQVKKLFIIDNCSVNINEIIKISEKYSSITLIKNANNMGIAVALNQMCKAAEESKYEWILTLDQDTIIPDGMIEGFIPFTSDAKIGILCPAVFYVGLNKRTKGTRETDYVRACMTSSSLTRIEAWRNVGGFNESYFIDFVDNEFCMKLSLAGYKVLRVNSYEMIHQLGTVKEIIILGLIRRKVVVHSALRYYYMIRNNYVFIKDYKRHLPVIKEWIKFFFILVSALAYSDTKKDTFNHIRKGITDAHSRRMGQLTI